MQSADIIIIGDGIAAKLVITYLNKFGLDSIIQIADDQFAPACSTRTTAINCLRGTQKGLSPLGDLIIKSFADFEKYYQEEKPFGISKSYEIQSWADDSIKKDQWQRRFTDFQKDDQFECFNDLPLKEKLNYVKSKAYIISPEKYYSWLEKDLKRNKTSDYIIEVNKLEDKIELISKDGHTYYGKKLILCTSYMTQNFSTLVADQNLKRQLEHSKPVAGTYIRFERQDFLCEHFNWEQSFSFALDEIHFIYRKESDDVLIGASSKNNQLSFIADTEILNEQYERISKVLGQNLYLPPLEKAQYLTGIRHKGQRRTPYWGEINSDIFAIWGLYKNAFTFAFTAAKEVAQLIKK